MYRRCIVCVAHCVLKARIGQAMEYFKASFLAGADSRAARHKNLNCRIVSVIAWHIAPAGHPRVIRRAS